MTQDCNFKDSIHPSVETVSGLISRCNHAFLDTLGYRASDLLGQPFESFLDNDKQTLERLPQLQQEHLSKHPIYLIKSANGMVYPALIERHQLAQGNQRISLRMLQHNATDPITNLPMGWAIDIQAMKFYEEHNGNQNFGYLILRVENFASVNIRYDYATGDRYLVKVAELLQNTVGKDWLIARYSSAKFALMHIGDPTQDSEDYHHYVERCCKAICQAFSQPLLIDGYTIRKSVSIGANSDASKYEDFKTLDLATEVAFLTSQGYNKSNYAFANAEAKMGLLRRKLLIDDLPLAVENNDIELVYQPLYHIASRQVIGFEALARWSHHSLGTISPVEFIEIAEQTSYFLQFDLYVLRKACLQWLQWRDQFGHTPTIAVNFSAKTLQINDLDKMVSEVFSETGCPASAIEIEITETAEITHYQDMFVNIVNLRGIGVNTVLDDFGTGYCSLHMLRRLADKVSKIKIDRQFLNDIHGSEFNQLLFRQVIEMSHMLNIKVLAEGIEEPGQLALLDDFGCDFAQGFYLHRPVQPKQLLNVLKQASENPES